jgi:hypothetical protein
MLCILKIGYNRFLLPSERGLQTVLLALSKAQRIEDDDRHRGGGISCVPIDEISSEMLPHFKFVKRENKEVLIPEVLPPNRMKPEISGSQRQRLGQGRLQLQGY